MEEIIYMPASLMSCTHVVVNNKRVSFNSTEKNVYALLATRIESFKKQYKNYCYDSQEDIATMCGISVRKVGRILSKFIDLGILHAEKINPRKWVYRDISDLLVILPEGNKVNISKELFSSVSGVSKKKNTTNRGGGCQQQKSTS